MYTHAPAYTYLCVHVHLRETSLFSVLLSNLLQVIDTVLRAISCLNFIT